MIELKSKRQIERIRDACQVSAKTLQYLRSIVKPGMTTAQVDQAAYDYFTAMGAVSLFKWYPKYEPNTGFPGNICISVNEEVVHGIGGSRRINEGDLVSMDCGVRFNGYCGDCAISVLIGKTTEQKRQLMDTCQKILNLAIELCLPGKRWSQIAARMQHMAESNGYSVVTEFVGHGIGKKMHEDPKVPNYVSDELLRNDFDLQPGLVMAVEPMINLGGKEVKVLTDGWTVVTKDGMPAAHVEHTLAITENGADVLTRVENGSVDGIAAGGRG